ncbi:hypothetical protein C8R45DRAFT_1139143 [Mycena sanguinolenta]|nr:hypothetical protein C8R45DRAFT_1139143 [Mycena sanguinolenta]
MDLPAPVQLETLIAGLLCSHCSDILWKHPWRPIPSATCLPHTLDRLVIQKHSDAVFRHGRIFSELAISFTRIALEHLAATLIAGQDHPANSKTLFKSPRQTEFGRKVCLTQTVCTHTISRSHPAHGYHDHIADTLHQQRLEPPTVSAWIPGMALSPLIRSWAACSHGLARSELTYSTRRPPKPIVTSPASPLFLSSTSRPSTTSGRAYGSSHTHELAIQLELRIHEHFAYLGRRHCKFGTRARDSAFVTTTTSEERLTQTANAVNGRGRLCGDDLQHTECLVFFTAASVSLLAACLSPSPLRPSDPATSAPTVGPPYAGWISVPAPLPSHPPSPRSIQYSLIVAFFASSSCAWH